MTDATPLASEQINEDDCPYCAGHEEVEARVADGSTDYIPCPHPCHRIAALSASPAPSDQDASQAQGEVCTVPPAGWRCTRAPGHDGPCAAVPINDGLEDEISDALTDSLDMDWTGSVGARAVMQLLREKGIVA